MKKLKVKKEGRKGIYLPERKDLKEFIKARKLKQIHNFIPSGAMMIGADHSLKSVLKDIDDCERLAIVIQNANMGHCLSLILKDERGERLEVYDIGKITEEDLVLLD